ncbi:MAG TPA: non-canonical purine NTP pyrophosphatase [archaeon]|nr:non-canonical purine NTP pyrophosphatase [archaeon]
MPELFFATANEGKFHTTQSALKPFGITLVQAKLELPEPRAEDVREIAKRKAVHAFSLLRKPVMAHDAGFYIHSLNGFPKAYVNLALSTIGVEGLLKLLEGKPRECEFRHCLAFMDESLDEPKVFEGRVAGSIAMEKRGAKSEKAWSDLWHVFMPSNGGNRVLAEFQPEELRNWRRENDDYIERFAEWFATRKT